MTYIRMLPVVLILAGCAQYPAYTQPPAVDGSLCQGVEGFCDPVEKLHTDHAKKYLDAVAAGKKPPTTDPSLDPGYSDEERGMKDRMPNARTIGR